MNIIHSEQFRDLRVTIVLYSLSRFSHIFIAMLYTNFMQQTVSLYGLFYKYDCGWYDSIVQNGYTVIPIQMQANWAFFPLYPFLIKGLCKIFTFVSTVEMGMLISNICIIIASYFSVRYIRLTRKNMLDPYIPSILLLMGPYAFYFNTMYTESLFIMLLIIAFYVMKLKKFLIASILIGFASATRVVGALLVFPLIYNMYISYREKLTWKNISEFFIYTIKRPLNLLSILSCPIGTFSYMLYLHQKMGDAWAFSNVQIAWGKTTGIKLFIKNFMDGLGGKNDLNSLYFAWFTMIAFLLLYVLWRDKRYDEIIFAVMAVVIPLYSSLNSMPRYIIGAYFFVISFSQYIYEKTKYTNIIISCFLMLELVFVWCWFDGAFFMI